MNRRTQSVCAPKQATLDKKRRPVVHAHNQHCHPQQRSKPIFAVDITHRSCPNQAGGPAPKTWTGPPEQTSPGHKNDESSVRLARSIKHPA